MTKAKKSKKPPSRKRYEEEHRTRSVRLDRETNEHLDKLLEGLELSFSGYVKAQIRKDEAMIEKKAEILASIKVDPLLEERVRFLESLLLDTYSLAIDTSEYPPLCPRCEDRDMLRCEGREMESNLANPIILTWKCPKCGFFLNTYHRIDPKSIKWTAPYSGKYIDKPPVSAKPKLKKYK